MGILCLITIYVLSLSPCLTYFAEFIPITPLHLRLISWLPLPFFRIKLESLHLTKTSFLPILQISGFASFCSRQDQKETGFKFINVYFLWGSQCYLAVPFYSLISSTFSLPLRTSLPLSLQEYLTPYCLS